MTSSYIEDSAISQDDLNSYYNCMEDISDSCDDSDSINNSDDELQYQLKLYSEGKIDDLSKMLDKKHDNQHLQTQQKPIQKKVTYSKLPDQILSKKLVPKTDTKKSIQIDHKQNYNNTTINPNDISNKEDKLIKKIQLVSEKPIQTTQTTQNATKDKKIPKIINQNALKYINFDNKEDAQSLIKESEPEQIISNITKKNDLIKKDTNITKPKLSEIQTIMKSWLEVDDEIKEINKISKTLRSKKKELTMCLLKDMNEFKIGYLSEGSQQLKYAVSYTKETYKKDYIMQKLTEYLKDPSMANKIADFLEESRSKKEKLDLKRGIAK